MNGAGSGVQGSVSRETVGEDQTLDLYLDCQQRRKVVTQVIEVKAYRIKGGAIVRVIRDGVVRRHRVGLKRFSSLKDWTSKKGADLFCSCSTLKTAGYYGRNELYWRLSA